MSVCSVYVSVCVSLVGVLYVSSLSVSLSLRLVVQFHLSTSAGVKEGKGRVEERDEIGKTERRSKNE